MPDVLAGRLTTRSSVAMNESLADPLFELFEFASVPGEALKPTSLLEFRGVVGFITNCASNLWDWARGTEVDQK